MDKSFLFTEAHKIAKRKVKKVGDYMIAFSLALKTIYRHEALARNTFSAVRDALEAIATSATEKQINFLASLLVRNRVLAKDVAAFKKLTKASASKLISQYN